MGSDDIPQDVWDAAEAMCTARGIAPTSSTSRIVAWGIVAERERCAGVCDQFLVGLPSNDTSLTARGIRELIRKGA